MLIGQIRGSEGKRDAFDDAFHPLEKHTRPRWLAIASTAVGAGSCRGKARDVGNMERHRGLAQGHLVSSAAGLESCPLESVYGTNSSLFRP